MDFDSEGDSSDVQSPGNSSDDEDCIVVDSTEGEGTPDIDSVILELEAELKVEENVQLTPGVQWSEEELLVYYQGLFEEFAVVRYEDITNLIVDGNMSLVCGDSLLLSCMRNDYHTQNGGQLLHLVYLCERLIQLLQRKSGVFEFVFFDIWRQTLVDESLCLARAVLETHLKKNTSIRVHHFDAAWDPAFKTFINICKPSFLLIDIDFPSVLSNFQDIVNVRVAEIFVYCQILFALSLDLPCVSLEKVELDISVISAFTVGRKLYKRKCVFRALEYLKQIIAGSSEDMRLHTLPLNSVDFGVGVDARHVVTVAAASWYLLECEDTYTEDWIRVFLLYSAVIEVLPLKNRGCPVPRETPSASCIAFIRKIQFYMKCALAQFERSVFTYDSVSDLWHGNLFISVLQHINSVLRSPDDLGLRTAEVYMRLTEEVYTVSGKRFEAFPIITENLRWNKPSAVSEGGEMVQPVSSSLDLPLERLLPTSCQLTWEFCGDLLHEVRQQVSEYDARIHEFITKEASYNEVRHWHSHLPLTDEHDRIRSSILQPMNDYEKRKYERLRNKMAKFMDTYGASIEGRQNISKTIICKSRIISKKMSKEKKMGKNALKIIKANIEGKEKDAKKVEDEMLDNFKDNFKKWKQKGEYEVALESAKILRKKLTSEEGIRRILMYIAQCCNLLWCEECRMKKKIDERDLTYAKELFLVVGQILTRSKETGIPLSDANKTELGKWLWRLGFGEVANLWKLPKPTRDDATFEVGLSWVRFQLLHLGADLKRESTGKQDPRVDFVPDPWQKELFDIIDQRKSALIVAPTSSGKTYASYYCMETILTEDDEGVVVYVSPTKALVNQVAATVYSRFKGKRMPEGKSVFGVFTRDYRTDDMNCQILVTVPQCLELLLLSPRRQAWVRKLRYVIFDEIHCLGGQAGGISWETCILMMRCPFLALSATIGNPESFHAWLQDAENFKRERDRLDKCERSSYKVHLVVHSERHSDLKKYIYTSEGDMIHIHPYAYIDESVIREHNGIPNHISLAAEETLQLYMAMEAASLMNDSVLPYKPETYFSTRSFLTRNEVRVYENCLRSLLQKWVVENMETYNAVIAMLKLPLEKASINEIGFYFVTSNFLNFIQKLKENRMFPTIFFRFDKGDLDYLFQRFVTYCSSLETDIQVSNNSSKGNDNGENKKQIKSLCRSAGRASDVMEISTRAGDFSLRRRQPFRDNRSLGLLEDSSSGSIRNVGFADKNDVEFVERRLIQSGYKWNDLFPSGLRVGLGKHHAAMNAKERSAVEMLFRMKVLNGVLATSTLALGIHMPCKTVVIGGDSLFLNTLSYHQMSGRAGRRGFDTEGNVVFFGMGERKIRTLLTGKLPMMIGNFPLTVTLILRLLLLVNDVSEKGVAEEDSKREAMSRALTYLNCNLVYQNIPELKDQMTHFFAFCTQLLLLQGVLDEEGKPQKVCGLLTHLHYHEPGNMVLVYLLRSGALRRLCKTYNGKIIRETELNLVLLLSHLFARLHLHSTCQKQKYKNSIVILPPLPETVSADVEQYNEEVEFMYDHYFRCVANHVANRFGEDDTLPLSGVRFGPSEPIVLQPEATSLEAAIITENVPRTICSQFVALSGHTDKSLYSRKNVISNIRHQVFTDVKVIPLLDCSVQLNSYAWDFYNHGILSSIIMDNGIRAGDAYNLLNDFKLMLLTVRTCLEEFGISPEDPVLHSFQIVSDKFSKLFNREFNITEKI